MFLSVCVSHIFLWLLLQVLLDSGVDFDAVCEARAMTTPLKYTLLAMLNNSNVDKYKVSTRRGQGQDQGQCRGQS